MGATKLLENLRKYLRKANRTDAVRCEQIDLILDKLEKKEHRLRKKLDTEKNRGKRKQLDIEVRIISLQRKKGIKRRRELEKKCK